MKHHLCPPELKLTTMLFGLAICLCGCSSSYSVRSTAMRGTYTYREMNEELKGRHVKIELKEGRDISAKEVKISDDSVSWVDQRTDEESKASIQQLDKIVIKNHFLGGLEGLGFGVVGGGGVGAAIDEIIYMVNVAFRTSSGGSNSAGLVYGAVAGGIVGITTGLLVGHSYNYEFPMTEQSDSLQHGK